MNNEQKINEIMNALISIPIGKVKSKLKTDFQIQMDIHFSNVRCYEYLGTEFAALISERFNFSYKSVQLGTLMRKKNPGMFEKYYTMWMNKREVA